MRASSFSHGTATRALLPDRRRRLARGVRRWAGGLLVPGLLAFSFLSPARGLGWGAPAGAGVNGVAAPASPAAPAPAAAMPASGRGGAGAPFNPAVPASPRLGTIQPVTPIRGPLVSGVLPGAPSPAFIPRRAATAAASLPRSPRLTSASTEALAARLLSPGAGASAGRSPTFRRPGDVAAGNPGAFRPYPTVSAAGNRPGSNYPAAYLRGGPRVPRSRFGGTEGTYPNYYHGSGHLDPGDTYFQRGFGYENGYGHGLGAAGCALGLGTYPFFTGYPVYAGLSYPVFLASGSPYATAAPAPAAADDDAPAPAATEENTPPAARPPADLAPGSATGRTGEPNSLVEAVQEELVRRGYLSGKPNGVLTPGTREALRHFQLNHELPPTGRVNEATLFSLGLN